MQQVPFHRGEVNKAIKGLIATTAFTSTDFTLPKSGNSSVFTNKMLEWLKDPEHKVTKVCVFVTNCGTRLLICLRSAFSSLHALRNVGFTMWR